MDKVRPCQNYDNFLEDAAEPDSNWSNPEY